MSGERVNRLRLEITTHCNMHCVFCPSDELQRPRRHIAHEQALRFLRSAPAIGNHLELNILGEPLLNPRVFEYLDQCEQHGPHVDLVTNATLLDEARLQRLFGYSNLTLWISLHTPTDRAMSGRGHAAIKTFGAYLDLLCAAMEAKFRYGSHVDLQIHVATELAKTETQSDSGPLWTLFPGPGEFEAGWNSCVERMGQLANTLREQYPAAYEAETALCHSRYREQFDSGAIVRGATELAPDSANREQVSWMALPNVFFRFKAFKLWTRQDRFLQKHLSPSQLLFTEPRPGPFTCPGANSLVLLSNGEYTLCCLDSDGEMGLGNINDVSPEEVLASPRRREVMENCATAEVCRRCQGTTFVLDTAPITAESQTIDKFGQGFHDAAPGAAGPTPDGAVRWTDGNANAFFYTRIDPAQLHLNFYSPHPDGTGFQAVFARFDAESKAFVEESSTAFTGRQGEYSHRELPVALRAQSFYRVTLVSPTVSGAAGMALGLGVAGMTLAGQPFDCAGAERERFSMTIAEQSHQRGLELFGQERYTEAAFWFEHAIARHETSELWNDWATAQLAANQAAEAERGYRRALELDPVNGLAAANLGVLLARSRQTGEAVALLERAANNAQVDPAQRSAIQQCLRQIRTWPVPGGNTAPVLSPAAPAAGTPAERTSSTAIHAMALAINCRNLDNFSDLLSRIEGAGGQAGVIALPWTGDPSHEQLPRMPFKMAAVRPIPELSPAGIPESDLSDLLATALKDRPDVLFMGDVQSYPSNVVRKLLQGMDRPPLCIGFQHGLSQCWWIYNRNFCCDYLFCFGNRHVLELKPELRPRAIPVGLAKLDRLQHVKCENRGFIVYVAQSSPEPEIVCPALNRYEEFTGMPVVVHDHPQFPGRYPFRSTLAHKLPPGIDGAQDVIALLAQADLVITPHSTAGLEALYLGKPVVLLPNHGLTAWNQYPGIAHAFTPQSIEAARKRALAEPDAIAMFLDDVVGGLRFDHTQRAFEALRGILDQRAADRRSHFDLGAAKSPSPDPGPAVSLGNAAQPTSALPAGKPLVVHVALSPLAAAPIRIVNALNRHTGYEARLVTKSEYAGRSFPNDILWDSGDHRQKVYELLEKASIVHLHHFIDLKHNFLEYDFEAAMRQGKVVVRHFHSNPQHVARTYKLSEEDLFNDPLPQFTTTQLHERFYPRAWLMPNLVPLDDEEYRPLPDKDYSRVKVHFQPSRPDGAMDDRWETKACPEVMAVLQGMGDACTVVHSPQAVEYRENLLRRRQCHVAIDDVITGSFHLTSLEALAQGLVAVSYLDRRQLWTLSRFTGAEELPWCCLRLEELAQGLPLLLRDRQLLAEMGAASRQWMERYWSPGRMIQHYVRAYDTLLAGDVEAFRQPRFDMRNTSHMWFAQTSDDLSWALHQKRLRSLAGV